jgi:hypothetical protein
MGIDYHVLNGNQLFELRDLPKNLLDKLISKQTLSWFIIIEGMF